MSAVAAALITPPVVVAPPPSYSAQPATPSVFAPASATAVDVPLSVINRPLPSELDEEKVQRFMRDIQAGDKFTPIEILRCQVPATGAKYYFAFGGCHRYEAHKRLGSETLRGTIINVPPSTIRLYLGASCPF